MWAPMPATRRLLVFTRTIKHFFLSLFLFYSFTLIRSVSHAEQIVYRYLTISTALKLQ